MKMSLSKKYIFADQWLHEATRKLSSKFIELGHDVPKIRVLYGFTTHGFSRSRKIVYRGECLARSWSKDNENIIFISPNATDEVDVLSTLAHEIAHAIDDCKSLHGKQFKSIMKDYGYLYDDGFEFPSLKLMLEFNVMSQDLGKFPSVSLA
jgi:hypothetical protein